MTGTAPGTAPRTGRRLFADLLRSRPAPLLGAAALATAAAALELAPYWLVYRIAQAATAPHPSATEMMALAALILGAAVARIVLFGAANILSHRLAYAAQKDLRVALIRALGRRPLGALEGRTGDLKKTLVDDVSGLEHLIAHTLPDAVAGLAAPLLAIALLLAVDWRMALASLALLPVAALAQRRAFSGMETVMAEWHAADAAANAALLSYVRGIATLRAFNRVASSLTALRQSVHALAALADRVTRRTAIPYALFFVALSTNLLVVLPLGLVLRATGTLDAATLVLFALLGAGLTAPLLRVMTAFGMMERQMQGAGRIAALLDAPAPPAPTTGRTPAGTAVELDAVSFAYGDGAPALHDVSFAAPAGGVTALVGPSGAGKSTLIRLVGRFADPASGAVRIGGVDLREMAPERLRDRVAIVFQDPYFFHGTIRENLAIASPGASVAAIDAVVAAVGLDDLAGRLPAGLDTPVADRAARLSGGERQRLAIARALLKDAPLLLLDEATAFADPESEERVQQAVARLTAGRTVLVIAHRLATVRDADRIVVLDRGRVDGVGRHDDLLAASPVYRRLWEMQERGRGWRLRV